MIPNILLVWLYMLIGWHLLRTQLRNHPGFGGWSVSGVSLTAVFPTCAVMHAAWLVYALIGRYEVDAHGLVVDWLSVPGRGSTFTVTLRPAGLGAPKPGAEETANGRTEGDDSIVREFMRQLGIPAARP